MLKNDLNKIITHNWMRLVKSSNREVSGASEVPQSRGKLIFLGSLAALFLFEN